jgi:excisionase family DNA binding protein
MSNKEETIEPLAVSIEEACRISGESRSQLYKLIADGEIEAKKSRSKTLVIYASLKKRLAQLPDAVIKRRKAG